MSIPPVEHAYHKPRFTLDKIQEVLASVDQIGDAIAMHAGKAELHQRFVKIKKEITNFFTKDIYYARNSSIATDVVYKLSEGITVNNETLSQVINSKPIEKKQPRSSLAHQHQIFLQRCEKNQQILQKQRVLEQAMAANVRKISNRV